VGGGDEIGEALKGLRSARVEEARVVEAGPARSGSRSIHLPGSVVPPRGGRYLRLVLRLPDGRRALAVVPIDDS